VKGYVKFGLVFWWLMGAFSMRAATGLIGSVVYVCSHAQTQVEVIDESDTAKRFSGGVDFEGIFRFPDLPPAQYSITITDRGFRDLTLHGLIIAPGVLKDIGPLRMMSPDVCVNGGPTLRIADGKLEMLDLCAVDFKDETPWCDVTLGVRGPVLPLDDLPEGFAFQTAEDGVYLIPGRGVSFSLNPSTVTDKHGCVNAVYVPGRIRIDSLPPGSRACVRTRWGRYAELRFKEEIAPGQKTATVEFTSWGIKNEYR
jgi:hypothetical protein